MLGSQPADGLLDPAFGTISTPLMQVIGPTPTGGILFQPEPTISVEVGPQLPIIWSHIFPATRPVMIFRRIVAYLHLRSSHDFFSKQSVCPMDLNSAYSPFRRMFNDVSLVLNTSPTLVRRAACSTGLVGPHLPLSRPASRPDTGPRGTTARRHRASTPPGRSPRSSDRRA
jgi:hypothetical protein